MASRTPIARVTCPTCGLNRVVKRTGTNAALAGKAIKVSKGIFHFGGFEMKTDFPLLRWYVSIGRASAEDAATGLKKSGWTQVDAMTIEQAVNDPAWAWVADDLYRRSKELIERIDNARKRK